MKIRKKREKEEKRKRWGEGRKRRTEGRTSLPFSWGDRHIYNHL